MSASLQPSVVSLLREMHWTIVLAEVSTPNYSLPTTENHCSVSPQ